MALMGKRWAGVLAVCIFTCVFLSAAQAERLRLKVALLPDGAHRYYHDLLYVVLKAAGHEPILEETGIATQIQIEDDLMNNRLSLHWFLQTDERDRKFVPVRVGITHKSIGKRILFIPKGQQGLYDGVDTLAAFRALGKRAALGKIWFDVEVWQHNDLPYTVQDGDWQAIYHKVAKGVPGFDYFPRGANEIIDEALQHPELVIEKRLILAYDRDFYFYLSKAEAKYQALFESAFKMARDSGIIDNLMRKYFAGAFNILDMENRIVIPLQTPDN